MTTYHRLSGHGRKRKVKILADKYGWICHYCGTKLALPIRKYVNGYSNIYIEEQPKNTSAAILEHKIPIATGGNNDISNLLLSCSRCNTKKGIMDYNEFIAIVKMESK